MKLTGKLTFPGDKSISHRALMLAALTDGRCIIDNLSTGKDVESTRQCLAACGIVSNRENGKIWVEGSPFQNPFQGLDCGNSGTTARLLAGLLSGQKISATLQGDNSLSNRPMDRITEPLTQMGASVSSTNGHLPLTISPLPLHGILYTPPIASAQVKSAVLLAGLGAEGETTVRESVKTRDHTERMLKAFGCPIKQSGNTTSVTSLQQPLETFELAIPGDPSTAAFFAAAAALIPKSELILKNVLANPTRSGFFGALEKMGAGMECLKKWDEGGDEVQNLKVSERPLTGITITSEQVPALIDELPILAVVATQAEGRTEVRGAGELRVKECDRLSVICTNLHRMGADVMELPDGFIITGPTQLCGAQISTFNDHRIAMAFTIAGHIAHESIELDDLTCVNISCPEFSDMLRKVIT